MNNNDLIAGDLASILSKDLENLNKQKEGMLSYLYLKASQEDWHGVADAAMDIREIISKITIINEILENT
jgi:hypothetical protein